MREYERALVGLRRSVGDKSTNTITVTNSLALEVQRAGHIDSAVAMLRRALAVGLPTYGEGHPVVASTRVNLGGALVAQHHYADGIAMTTAGLRVLDVKLGRRALTSRNGRRSLLTAYVATGDSANAARIRAELADSVASPPAKK